MRTTSYIVHFMLLTFVCQAVAHGQSPLERLESGIRGNTQTLPGDAQAAPFSTQLPPPLPTPAGAPPTGAPTESPRPLPSGQRGYLGAIVDDRNELGRGLRVLSVAAGGPADRAGLKPRDLIFGAGGTRVRQMRDITIALSQFGPGDKVAFDILRGVRSSRIEIVLGETPSHPATQLVSPPAPPVPGIGDPAVASPPAARSSETIPAPPSIEARKPTGPFLESPDARVDAMQKKIDDLEQRIERLERELAEARKKS